jgi:hypothetical protein
MNLGRPEWSYVCWGRASGWPVTSSCFVDDVGLLEIAQYDIRIG